MATIEIHQNFMKKQWTSQSFGDTVPPSPIGIIGPVKQLVRTYRIQPIAVASAYVACN